MTVLAIRIWPDPVLTTQAKPVAVFDGALKQLVEDMHETMEHANGIGLAANQVGELKRVLTIHIPSSERCEKDGEKSWWFDKKFTFVNPEIVKKSGMIRWQEGCLSFPEMYDFVDRASEITVKAFDVEGREFCVDAHGLFSVCLQHEIDHLDGVVFIARMSRLKAQIIRKKMIQKAQSRMSNEPNP